MKGISQVSRPISQSFTYGNSGPQLDELIKYKQQVNSQQDCFIPLPSLDVLSISNTENMQSMMLQQTQPQTDYKEQQLVNSQTSNSDYLQGNKEQSQVVVDYLNSMGISKNALGIDTDIRRLDSILKQKTFMQQQESNSIQNSRAGPRIFVGKLSKDVNEQDVKDCFSRFGYVLDVYLPKNKDNKSEHRGFGFITFETQAAVQRVVANGAHKLKGQQLAIDVAIPRKEDVQDKQNSLNSVINPYQMNCQQGCNQYNPTFTQSNSYINSVQGQLDPPYNEAFVKNTSGSLVSSPQQDLLNEFYYLTNKTHRQTKSFTASGNYQNKDCIYNTNNISCATTNSFLANPNCETFKNSRQGASQQSKPNMHSSHAPTLYPYQFYNDITNNNKSNSNISNNNSSDIIYTNGKLNGLEQDLLLQSGCTQVSMDASCNISQLSQYNHIMNYPIYHNC